MKKILVIGFLLVGGTCFSQNYTDSVILHGMRMDSIKFEISLDSVKINMLMHHYVEETDVVKLVDIIEDLRDLQEKMTEDKKVLQFEASEVIRLYVKKNSREL